MSKGEEIKKRPHKRRVWKWITCIISVIILIVLALGISLPTILSSSWGKNAIIKSVNKRIHGGISIKKINLGWWSGIEIEGFELYAPNGQPVIQLESVEATTSLWSFIWGSRNYGTINVEGAIIQLSTFTSSPSNLQEALAELNAIKVIKSSPHLASIGLPPKWVDHFLDTSIDFSLKNGNIRFSFENSNPIEFRALETKLQLSQSQTPLEFQLQADTFYGEETGSLSCTASLTDINKEDIIKLWSTPLNELNLSPKASFGINLNALNIPTVAIDKIMNLTLPKPIHGMQLAFGPFLNTELQLLSTPKTGSLTLSAQSEFFHINLAGRVKDSIFTLDEPVSGQWQLNEPFLNEVIETYLPDPLFEMINNSSMSISIDQLSFPTTFLVPDLSKLQLHSSFTVSENTIVFPKAKENLTTTPFTLEISTPSNTTHLDFKLNGSLKEREYEIPVNFQMGMKNLFTPSENNQSTELSWNAELSTGKIPTQLALKIMNLSDIYENIIGPTFYVELSDQFFENRHSLSLSFYGDFIRGIRIPFTLSDSLFLNENATINFSLPHTAIEKIIHPIDYLKFKDQIKGSLTLNQVLIPVHNIQENEYEPKKIQLASTLNFAPIYIEQFSFSNRRFKNLTIRDLNISLSGNNLSNAAFSIEGNVSQSGKDSPLNTLFGPSLTFKNLIQAEISSLKKYSFPSIKLSTESSKLNISLLGSINEDKELSLNSSSIFSLDLSPKALQYLQWTQPNLPTLANTINLKGNIELQPLDITNLKNNTLALTSNFSIPEIQLKNNEELISGSINDLNMSIEVNGPQNFIKKSSSGSIILASQGAPGTFANSVLIQDVLDDTSWSFSKSSIKSSMKAENIPVIFLEGLINQKGNLTHLFGQDINLDTQIDIPFQKSKTSRINLDLAAQRLNIKGKIDGLGGQISTYKNEPIILKANLTPQGYQVLLEWLNREVEDESVLLSDAAAVNITIEDLKLYLSEPLSSLIRNFKSESIQLRDSVFNTSISIPLLSIHNTKNKEKVLFQNFTSVAQADPMAEVLHFSISSLLKRTKKQTNDMSSNVMSFSGEAKNLFFKDSDTFNFKGLELKINGELKEFPIGTFNRFLPFSTEYKKKLLATFGNDLTAHIDADIKQLTGPFSLHLESQQSKADIIGNLKNGNMHLERNIDADILINKLFGQAVLYQVSPLFKDTIASPFPINLVVEKDNFTIPLFPTNSEKISIPNAEFLIGKIILKNEGFVQKLLSVFNDKTEKGADVSAWFTPINWNIKNGTLNLERADTLIQSRIHLATWGTVDLKTKNANLTIGVTGDTLARTHSIKGYSNSYLFLIPITGPLDNLSVNWGEVTARLATLAGTQLIPGGAIVNQIIGLSTGDQRIPPAPEVPWTTDDIEVENSTPTGAARSIYTNPFNIFNQLIQHSNKPNNNPSDTQEEHSDEKEDQDNPFENLENIFN
jgi:hypothetical protein